MKRRNFLGYSLLFVAGCTATTTPHGGSDNSAANRPERLRFAVTDAQGLEELQRNYEAFRSALEEILGVEVEFFPVENFIAAAPALKSDRVDLVWAGPAEYVVVRARTNAVPIVGVTRPGYYSVIAVRADSGIESVADLKGKTIDMRKVGSTSSHLGAIELLLDAGLNPQSDVNIVMSGDYSLEPLKSGKVDAVARGGHRYEKVLREEGALPEDYPLVAEGQPLPNDVMMANSKLDPEFVEEMRSRMLANADKLLEAILASEFLAKKFKGATLVPANDADYDRVREVYRAIGQGELLE